MNADEQPWQQRPDESARWYNRFAQFLALGAGRSVRAVYNAEKNHASSKPTPASWTEASHRFDWVGRAEQYDAWRREIVFSTGNAQDTERIKKLDMLIEKLCELITTIIERVDPGFADIDQLTKLIAQFLAAIDLLAKHTGGYAPQRIEHTGKDGGKIEVSEERKVQVVFYLPEVEDIEAGNESPEDQDGTV
jgi:hypothetical protein